MTEYPEFYVTLPLQIALIGFADIFRQRIFAYLANVNFDNSQFEIKGNVERRSVEVYSFLNDILSAELSIQHPISKQSKAYIRGGEFGDSAFLYAFQT